MTDAHVRERPALAWLSYVWLLLCALVPMSTVYYVMRAFMPIQWSDQWVEIEWLDQAFQGHWTIADLWRPHYEHPIFVPRAFFLLDELYFNGTNRLLVPLNCLTLVGMFGALLVTAKREELPFNVRALLAGIYMAILFAAVQMENLFWGFQLTFLLVLLGAVASISFFVWSLPEEVGARVHRGAFAASLMSAYVTTFCMANGVLIWGLLLVIGALSSRRKFVVPTVVVGGGLAAASWLALIESHGDPVAGLMHPLRQILFVSLYLGSPWSALSWNHAGWRGGVGLLLAVVISVCCVLRWKSIRPYTRIHVAILWFTVASGLATALGRSEWGLDAATNVRYSSTALVFWCSLLSVLMPRNSWRRSPFAVARAVVFLVLVLTCLGWIVPAHRRVGERFVAKAHANLQDSMALVADVYDPEAYNRLCVIRPDVPPALTAFSREHHLGIFAQAWTHRMANVIPGFAEAIRTENGAIDEIEYLNPPPQDSPTQAGVRVTGHYRAESDRDVPQRILFLDREGRMRGAAACDAKPPFWDRTYPLTLSWRGYAQSDARVVFPFAQFDEPPSLRRFDEPQLVAPLRSLASLLSQDDWHIGEGWVPNRLRNTEFEFESGYAWSAAGRIHDTGAELRSAQIDVHGICDVVIPVLWLADENARTANGGVVIADAGANAPLMSFDLTLAHNRWRNWVVSIDSPTMESIVIVGTAPISEDGSTLVIGEPRRVDCGSEGHR